MKEKYEKERIEKADKDRRESVKRDSKKASEQVFQKALEPDLSAVLVGLQKQVAELVAAEKARKQQEQMNYQSWYPVHIQNT